MILAKQTQEDFLNFVESVKEEYNRKQKDYDWKFSSFYENFADSSTYFFSNAHETTKIMYIPSAKLINTYTIGRMELKIINELQEGLSK